MPLSLKGEAACTAKPRRLIIKERITFSPIPLSSSFRFPKRNQIICVCMYVCVCVCVCLRARARSFCYIISSPCLLCLFSCFVSVQMCVLLLLFLVFGFVLRSSTRLLNGFFFFVELNTRTQVGLESTNLTVRRRKCYLKLIRSKKH